MKKWRMTRAKAVPYGFTAWGIFRSEQKNPKPAADQLHVFPDSTTLLMLRYYVSPSEPFSFLWLQISPDLVAYFTTFHSAPDFNSK